MKLAINDSVIEAAPPTDKTLLQFVRERGLTGTKEGCASGDCGACTVMVGELVDGKVQYQTVNACIVPVGQMANRHVVTVEGLEGGNALHPAQIEMIASHGSQCGFCTPGFVVSLAALVEAGETPTRETVLKGISGNLCRCTGYRPIVEAGLRALEADYESELGSAGIRSLLSATDNGDGLVSRPHSLSELGDMLGRYPDARLIAGGTDLMLEVTQLYRRIPRLIDVTNIEELSGVTMTDTHIVIGAAASYTSLETFFPEISEPLIQLLERLGSRQIRNRGTVGGNLANGSPIADMPPVLIAWDAEIEIMSATGALRTVATEDFYIGYRETVLDNDDLITRIRLPRDAVNRFHRFYKSSKRIEDDISSVMGAFSFAGDGTRIEEARVAFGGMAAVPVRLRWVEAALEGSEVTEELVDQVTAMLDTEMSPLTDVRSSADYRSDMAKTMLRRALDEYLGNDHALITAVEIDA